jgi:peptidoglycan hydrolase-like protein with peptidoglycan-binding domain
MKAITIGALALAGDVTSIPKAGVTYTDAPTVRAVQKALKAQGFDPGTIDGIYGPKTAAAIRSMQLAASQPQTGIIDYSVLMALGVSAPQGGQATSASAPSSPASSFVPSVLLPSATPAAPGVVQPDNFWTRPVWAGAPIKGWQAVFGGVASLALAFGIVSAVRR